MLAPEERGWFLDYFYFCLPLIPTELPRGFTQSFQTKDLKSATTASLPNPSPFIIYYHLNIHHREV
jgi:hypothetical protein